MAYLKSKGARIMDKFHKKKFSLWKFKMKMVLASMGLWGIVDGSKEAPPSNADSKVLKEYQRPIKKAMFITGLNLMNNQLG